MVTFVTVPAGSTSDDAGTHPVEDPSVTARHDPDESTTVTFVPDANVRIAGPVSPITERNTTEPDVCITLADGALGFDADNIRDSTHPVDEPAFTSDHEPCTCSTDTSAPVTNVTTAPPAAAAGRTCTGPRANAFTTAGSTSDDAGTHPVEDPSVTARHDPDESTTVTFVPDANVRIAGPVSPITERNTTEPDVCITLADGALGFDADNIRDSTHPVDEPAFTSDHEPCTCSTDTSAPVTNVTTAPPAAAAGRTCTGPRANAFT
ncbi:hypothetical protein, partial [Microbacterium oleivorans]|uniref:hypothetical protein n=1 Tax=Microbacterium oleivorans TaxID=273677 RepID=UPI001F0FF8FA